MMPPSQTIDAEDVLSKVRLFEGLDRKHLSQIAKTAHVRTYASGEDIVREGDDGIGLYAIVSGQVEVFQRHGEKGRHLRTMRAGEVFGQLALLADRPRSATVSASEPTDCLVFTAWTFRAILAESPEIAVQLATTLAGWLIESEDRMAEMG